MKSMMKVKELIEILNKFDGDKYVQINGGENYMGEWSELNVGRLERETLTHYNTHKEYVHEYFVSDVTIMESE